MKNVSFLSAPSQYDPKLMKKNISPAGLGHFKIKFQYLKKKTNLNSNFKNKNENLNIKILI